MPEISFPRWRLAGAAAWLEGLGEDDITLSFQDGALWVTMWSQEQKGQDNGKPYWERQEPIEQF